MPELPDIVVYIEKLPPRIEALVLERARLASPFLLRSVEPPLDAVVGRNVVELRRLGKRIVWRFASLPSRGEEDLFLIFHLMIAGRLHWKERGAKLAAKVG